MIVDQVCDRDQVGVDHDKRSLSEECVPQHVSRNQQHNHDQEAIEIVISDQVGGSDQVGVEHTICSAISEAIAIKIAIRY